MYRCVTTKNNERLPSRDHPERDIKFNTCLQDNLDLNLDCLDTSYHCYLSLIVGLRYGERLATDTGTCVQVWIQDTVQLST